MSSSRPGQLSVMRASKSMSSTSGMRCGGCLSQSGITRWFLLYGLKVSGSAHQEARSGWERSQTSCGEPLARDRRNRNKAGIGVRVRREPVCAAVIAWQWSNAGRRVLIGVTLRARFLTVGRPGAD